MFILFIRFQLYKLQFHLAVENENADICHLLFWNSGKVNFRVNSRENQRSAVILLGQTVHSFCRECHLARSFDTKYSIFISYIHDMVRKMLSWTKSSIKTTIHQKYWKKLLVVVQIVYSYMVWRHLRKLKLIFTS